MRRPLALLMGLARAGGHLRYAESRGLVGARFGRHGRRIGWRLLLRGRADGLRWLINPVSCVRYFELDFAWRHLGGRGGATLDLASPRLWPFWLAAQGRTVEMLNPDPEDLRISRSQADALGLPGIRFHGSDARWLESRPEAYDAVSSLSVIEHIHGAYEEDEALRLAWKALRPGGRLVLTTPVDRRYRVETRPQDPYGTQRPLPGGGYFFQRRYDREALESRVIAAIGRAPTALELYGEKAPGTFDAYEARWREGGLAETAADPRLMTDHFQAFPDWASMPGTGVAGLVFDKEA